MGHPTRLRDGMKPPPVERVPRQPLSSNPNPLRWLWVFEIPQRPMP